MENWFQLQAQTAGLAAQQMGPYASTPNTYNKLCLKQTPRKKDESYLIRSHFVVNFLNPNLSCPYITTLGKEREGKKKEESQRRKTSSSDTHRFPATYWVPNYTEIA